MQMTIHELHGEKSENWCRQDLGNIDAYTRDRYTEASGNTYASSTVLATYSRPDIIFTHGRGLQLFAATDSGDSHREYLDFSSGIAVNSLGHADPQVAEVAAEQAQRLVHSSNLFHNEWSGELSCKMVELTGQHGGLGIPKGKGCTTELKVFLANSGTEANEAALKFARKYARVTAKDGLKERKNALVSFTNAFHGRTMGALSMTPNPKYKDPFAPLIPNVKTGQYNSVDGLETLIDHDTAGVIVEPVQGEGGIYPASLSFLQALRKRCDEVGALLIYDEIQCGLFRSGTLWCHSEFPPDAHPDLVTMAKPLANGFPIGAVLMRNKVADAIVVGDHGTTFGGGPLASRIAHHVLERLSNEEFGKQLKENSEYLFRRLSHLVEMFPDLISTDPHPSPRGKGFLVGISMKDPSNAGKTLKLARERGLIVLSAGSDTIRIAPSLNVSKEQIDKAVDVLESSMLVLRQQQTHS
ncbi:acetylornithine and succinylornithine aminotransferase [Tilletiaria anomala UBC 951]|uniref:acetylornithine transaminase n=1 Tax=Tilletiaria anomala (strain ATCC 24038 / CBS 436.72 / UBC 951) TaxID=1037660 RepID=A0A066W758_TILAU|nr:acetylornithine and succinylornithine aminotransferase [Tilletiaria anomala UBC 951]KDN46630.1 acetylornithine and succinylornithine aminotransferase [Tilletiaria anomala UBC 951]